MIHRQCNVSNHTSGADSIMELHSSVVFKWFFFFFFIAGNPESVVMDVVGLIEMSKKTNKKNTSHKEKSE